MIELDKIKVGDEITYMTSGWTSQNVITKVMRVTPKQFTDSRGLKFRKSDGHQVGEGYAVCKIATEEDKKRFALRQHRNKLVHSIIPIAGYSTELMKVSTEDLETIWSILHKYKK